MVLLSFSFCHVDKYIIIEKDSLKNAFILNSSSFFKGYFYLGTDDTFHYFESRWKLLKDKPFKIRIADLNVVKPFDFGQKKLRIDIVHIENSVTFGENEYYTLYIIDQ